MAVFLNLVGVKTQPGEILQHRSGIQRIWLAITPFRKRIGYFHPAELVRLVVFHWREAALRSTPMSRDGPRSPGLAGHAVSGIACRSGRRGNPGAGPDRYLCATRRDGCHAPEWHRPPVSAAKGSGHGKRRLDLCRSALQPRWRQRCGPGCCEIPWLTGASGGSCRCKPNRCQESAVAAWCYWQKRRR